MNCEGARSVVASWQAAGSVERAVLTALSDHVATCEGCNSRYRLVLPLIARDLRDAPAVEVPEGDEAFTRSVMRRIEGRTRTFPLSGGRRPLRRVISAAAAAAVLLLAAGLLIRGVTGGAGGAQSGEITVHFVLDAPTAQAVALVGSFNAWNPETLPLKREAGSQRWEISVKLKRGETYLYNFVVNGKTWIPDPTTVVQVEDGFGGESSLMQL